MKLTKRELNELTDLHYKISKLLRVIEERTGLDHCESETEDELVSISNAANYLMQAYSMAEKD